MTAPAQSSGRRLGMQPPQYVQPPAPMAAAGPRVVLPPAHMPPEPKAVPRVVPPRVQNAGMPQEPLLPPKAKWAQQAQQAHHNIAMAAAREQARSAADWALAQAQLDEHQQALDDAASDEEAEFLLAQQQTEEEAEAEELAAAYEYDEDTAAAWDDEQLAAAWDDEQLADDTAAAWDDGETLADDTAACDDEQLAYDTTAAWEVANEAWKAADPQLQHVQAKAKPYVRAKDRRGSVTRGGKHVQAKRKADMLGEGGLKMFVAYQAAEQLALETGAASRTFTEWQRDNRAGRNVGSSTSHERWGKAAHYQWGYSSSSSAGGQGHGTKRRR